MSNAKPLAAVFLVLGLILAGAVAYTVSTTRGVTYVEPLPETGQLSPALYVDVYVNGSGSMQSLLAGHGQNYLHDFLAKCESVLRNTPTRHGWEPMVVSYQKFGAKMTPLSTVGALSHLANSPKEFNEPRTPIEAPARDTPHARSGSAEQPEQAEVKIIITDLYQSDQANEKPAIALTQKYLSRPAGAVAVIGIRNPYAGPVEDLPGLRGRSLANAADSMPFYVIIAGDRGADVRTMERLLIAKTGLQGALEAKRGFAVYFSKDPGEFHEEVPTANWTPGTHKERAVGILEKSTQEHVDSLTLRKGVAQISWPEPAQTHFAYDVPAGDDPELKITPLVATQSATKSATKKDISKAEAGEAAKAAAPCSGSQAVCATIDRSKLKNGRPYLFRFDVIDRNPGDTFRPESSLMQEWNIEPADVERIAGGGDKKFPSKSGVAGAHPGMTPNLSQFLMALQGQTFHEPGDADVVRAATYYLYVKGR